MSKAPPREHTAAHPPLRMYNPKFCADHVGRSRQFRTPHMPTHTAKPFQAAKADLTPTAEEDGGDCNCFGDGDDDDDGDDDGDDDDDDYDDDDEIPGRRRRWRRRPTPPSPPQLGGGWWRLQVFGDDDDDDDDDDTGFPMGRFFRIEYAGH